MNKLTPIKAIRKFCCLCQGGNQKAPALCTNLDCFLYLFRKGKNPSRKGIGGKAVRKSNDGDISPTQVGKTEKVFEVSGNKRIRIITEDIEGEEVKK